MGYMCEGRRSGLVQKHRGSELGYGDLHDDSGCANKHQQEAHHLELLDSDMHTL